MDSHRLSEIVVNSSRFVVILSLSAILVMSAVTGVWCAYLLLSWVIGFVQSALGV